MNVAVESKAARVGALVKALQRLRYYHSEITVLQAQFFLLVAERPGVSQRELWETLGASDTAASRILAQLSDLGDRNRPGLDLITMETMKTDRRVRLLHLTKKGQQLVDDILGEFDRVSTS
jgi:DNA-binding MarR family transcriptional regulator